MVHGPRARLLRWFDAEARDLPWRRTKDPYAIWLSEVMLQQTRVDTVVRYWERFLERLPTVEALAAAPEDVVLSLFSGLGYYRRARYLHAAAKVIAKDHAGVVPRDPDVRRKLPGIGAYTAGAIGSIAFDLPEPIVDGNVARVLSRVHGIDAPLGSSESERLLWEHAARWARGPRPGALNQALMELGAVVCTSDAPRCGFCPLAASCRALSGDDVARLPVPRARKAPKRVRLVAVRVTTPKGVALLKSESALFGGLWGLPAAEVGRGSLSAAATLALEAAHIEPTTTPVRAGALVHVLTHRRLEVTLFDATAARVKHAFDRRRLEGVGISTLTKKLLAL